MLAAAILFCFCPRSYAADENTTSTGYRISGLVEKLSLTTHETVETILAGFSDMKKHWSREFVGKLAALEIVKGMPDGTFKPDNPVKVDEFLTMTVKSLGYKPEGGSKYWAEPFIKIAKEQKLIDSNEFTDFSRNMTREQAAKIIVRAAMLKETAPSNSIYNYIRGKIKDYPKISDKYKQNVLEAYAIGFFKGTPQGYFQPRNTLTRGEAATIIIKNLDTSLRTPLKPDASETLVMKDLYGKSYEIYPSLVPETFEVAKALSNSTSKSKGYAFMMYNPFEEVINCAFFHSEDAWNKSHLDFEGGLAIHTLGNEPNGILYFLTVYKCKEFKELHMDVMVEGLKVIFGSDADKAIAVFDHYLDIGINSENKYSDETFTFNNRKMNIVKYENLSSIGVLIYPKTR